MELLQIYLLTLVVFFAVDILWLGYVSKGLYKRYLGHYMAEKVNWTAALIFYGLFIAGLVYFVIQPALDKESLVHAMLAGGFFGLVTYGTYDLTNLATLKDWPLPITVVDLVWGTVLNAATASITYLIAMALF